MRKRNFLNPQTLLSLLCAAALLSGCGGGSGDWLGDFNWSMPSYYIGGTVSGLSGTLVLQNNGGDDRMIKKDGVFKFKKKLKYGDTYKVTVLSRPDLQNVCILNGSGTVESEKVMNIEVVCSDKCWTHPKELSENISPDGQQAYSPKTAMDDNGNAVIVWEQDDGNDVKIFKSEYRNGTWVHPNGLSDNISPDGADAYFPTIAMSDNGDAVVAWRQGWDIFMSEYRNGAWKHPKGLSDFISVEGYSCWDVNIAMDDKGDTVIVWAQYDKSNIRQVFKSEFRQGAWTHPQDISDNISPDGTDIHFPRAAMDNNGNAIIVWYQYVDGKISQVFKSEYRQGFWTHPKDLWDNISPDGKQIFHNPDVAMDDNDNVVITWAQYDDNDIRQIYKSEYRQGTWFHPKNLFDNISPDGTNARSTCVAMDDDNNAVITWHQYDGSGKTQIFKSEYRLGSWAHPIDQWDNISPDGQDDAMARVAMDDNGNAVIAWHQVDANGSRIFKSEYRHGVWTHPATLSDNINPDSQNANAPDVAMDNNGNTVIAWKQIDDDKLFQIFKSEFR